MRLSVAVAVACLTLVGLSAAAESQASIKKHTDIPAEGLGAALETLAKDRNFQIVYVAEEVSALRTQGAVGELTSDEALKKLLTGTGLTFRYLDEKTVTIVPVSSSLSSDTSGTSPSAPNTQPPPVTEEPKVPSDRFRMAQVDQGTSSASSSVKKKSDQEAKKKGDELQEVVVTGSRIPRTAKEGAQDVNVYTREQIDQSGQGTIADFLNTLPSVSTATTESGTQVRYASTTIQLRGLPYGTTLVLINGRRIETSGSQGANDFFDLNNIPLAAVERIEVVADGSSAIYGSDAIAGVVNIILKKSINGLGFSAKYGSASDISEWDNSVTWGKGWDKGAISIVASDQTRNGFDASKRRLTASNDYTTFGGPNNNFPVCHPGNVFSTNGQSLPGAPPGSNATFAAVTGNVQSGKPTFGDFTYGVLNECAIAPSSIVPATHRSAIYGQGNYNLTSTVELFTELMYSHIQLYQLLGHPFLFGVNGFQSFSAAASNPYNPFGQAVGVSDVFASLPEARQNTDTVFFRPLVGARGTLLEAWRWELSAWDSEDRTNVSEPVTVPDNTAIQNALNSSNPATALNPFVAGPQGSSQLLNSLFSDGLVRFLGRGEAINGFVSGPLLKLPSGQIDLVVGSEYDRDTLSFDEVAINGVPPNTQSAFHRDSYAAFGEARVPIIANPTDPHAGDTFAATLAGRFDHYSDFGSITTPQFGLEWRPLDSLLLRGSYAHAFKAPPLPDLYTPSTSHQSVYNDPLTGKPEQMTIVQGGNPSLNPEKGRSHTFGIVYSSKTIPDFRLTITNWNVIESNTIENVSPLVLIDNEPSFPGDVIRASNCSGKGPCPITRVIDTFVNFGNIDVAGIDYQLNYSYKTEFGTWTPSINASETYRYVATLTPGSPALDSLSRAQDSGNWAPRWKGTVALQWKRGVYSANVDGRYIGRYQDYDSTRQIGNFWLCDANFRYAIGNAFMPNSDWAKGAYIEVGAVNLFNSLPQFSNYDADFLGYDPTQADIRGRFIYASFSVKL